MFVFARLHLGRWPALVAAVAYVYLPYHLVDLYVRGALAESLAFVWFPVVLWAFHRLVETPPEQRGLLGLVPRLAVAALSLVALVVTHSLSALLFAPLLAGYVAVLWWVRRGWRTPIYVGLALALALALSAFYWLPVLLESGYVGLGYGASQGYRAHLLPLARLVDLAAAYDYAGAVVPPVTFPLGWVQAAILVGAIPLVFVYRRRRPVLLLFLAAGLFSALMLSDVLLPVWRLFEPGLAFLQYPWRFHAIGALATATLAGMVVETVARRSAWVAGAAGTALLLALAASGLWALPVQPAAPEVTVEAMWRDDRSFGQVGATWTGEYLPIWVEVERWAISHPAPTGGGAGGGGAARAGDLQLVATGHTRYRLDLDTDTGATVALHQFYYPGWQAEWQGAVIAARPAGELGLASFELPPGSGVLTLRLAPTAARGWGTAVALVTALVVAVALVARLQTSGLRRTRAVEVASLGGCLLLAAVLLASLALPNGYVRDVEAVGAELEGGVELLAFRLGEAQAGGYRPGDSVEITLYWRALADLMQDYKVSVQLTDVAVTRQPAQHDGDPGRGYTPTTRWLPGEVVPDPHALSLPADLAPGRYRLWAAMYEYPAVRNLAVVTSPVQHDGERVLLAEIEVVGR
jgi:hypothetical protein